MTRAKKWPSSVLEGLKKQFQLHKLAALIGGED
jgi:hypothetical protein